MEKSFYARYHVPILAGVLFFLPFAIIGAIHAKNSNKNQVKDWLPDDLPENQQYRAFRGRFHGDEFILASWEGCSLDMTRPADLAGYDQGMRMMLRKLAPEDGSEPLFKGAITVPGTLDQIARESIVPEEGEVPRGADLSKKQLKQAIDGLTGWLIGSAPLPGDPNRRMTCLVLKLSEAGLKDMRACVERVRKAAVESGIKPEELHMGGPPVDNQAIDLAGEERLMLLFGLSILIGICVSWYSLHSLWLVLLVVLTGVYSMFLSLALLYYTGQGVNAIVLTMPTLVYVATTSGAIHLANYYRDSVRAGTPATKAPGDAVKHAMLPLSLATGTTAVGLLTLYISDLVPIQMFGLFSAAGVCVSFLLLCFFIPAALQAWPTRLSPRALGPDEDRPHARWRRVGEFIARRHALVMPACLLLMAGIGWGITRSRTEVQLMKFFSDDARILQDYAWLEQNLGPLVPMEVVVTIDKQTDLKDIPADSAEPNYLERLKLVRRLQREIEKLDSVGTTMATTTFIDLSTPPRPASLPKAVRIDLLNKGLVDAMLALKPGAPVSLDFAGAPHSGQILKLNDDGQTASVRLTAGPQEGTTVFVPTHTLGLAVGDYLREVRDPQTGVMRQIFRISARVRSRDVDYAAFTSELKVRVNPAIEEFHNKGFAGIDVKYTGVMPLIYAAQHSLLEDLIFGFFTDFALIVIVMMIACRDWAAGPVLLLPAAFPAIVVFGLFGWLDIPVDIGTVMAPAVALGVTVDDVVHFMLWFRRGIAQGMTRVEAVMLAYRGCARAMYQSWGVIGIGLAVYGFSPFVPTQKFGYLMVALLTAALVGNLLLLPSLLAGPLGAIFAWGIRRKTARAEARAERREQAAAASAGSEHIPEPHLRPEVARRSSFTGH